jgi:uncharacterized protein YdbL (DUF1318 family)
MRNAARWLALVSALALVLAVAPALAGSLDDAKAAGQVGERLDGYLGLVDASAPGDVKALVESVNAGRRQKYAEIAAKQSTTTKDVAALAGAKLIERTQPGHYVMDASGSWKRK